MKRRIEFGCLLILTILWFLLISAWLFAQSSVQMSKQSFRIEYRPDLGVPVMVDWQVSRECLGEVKREPNFKFKEDKECPKPRVKSKHYNKSGYHRGHMCPAADRSKDISSMKSTFIMSNVCPMLPKINTGAWKRTEDEERRLAKNGHVVNVRACALYYPNDTLWIGGGRVAVPHAFIKFMWTDDEAKIYKQYIVENK